MHIIWILLTCAAGVAVFMVTERAVSSTRFGRGWRLSFWSLSLMGFAIGIWLVNLRYLKTSTLRLYGFPFPIAGGEFMNGRWVDGLVGNPLALVADVGGAIGVCLLPLLVTTLLKRSDGRTTGELKA